MTKIAGLALVGVGIMGVIGGRSVEKDEREGKREVEYNWRGDRQSTTTKQGGVMAIKLGLALLLSPLP